VKSGRSDESRARLPFTSRSDVKGEEAVPLGRAEGNRSLAVAAPLRVTALPRMAALLVIGMVGILLVAGTACTTHRPTATREADVAEDLPILWQKSGLYSRLNRRVRLVARDARTLAQIPIAEIPVDFRTQMVLIAGLGPTPNSELGIAIVRVWQEGTRIRVQERSLHPGVDRATGLEPASPWTIAIVPRSELNVDGYDTRVPRGALADHPGSR